MAHDPLRQRVVVFGGQGGAGLADTLEWDGERWEERATPVAPSARWGASMVFDPIRRKTHLRIRAAHVLLHLAEAAVGGEKP